MEHFKSILFHTSEPANKQHTYQSTNQIFHTSPHFLEAPFSDWKDNIVKKCIKEMSVA